MGVAVRLGGRLLPRLLADPVAELLAPQPALGAAALAFLRVALVRERVVPVPGQAPFLAEAAARTCR
jgi:hypothetical protein